MCVSVSVCLFLCVCKLKGIYLCLLELDSLVWCKEDQVVQVEDRLVECPPVDQIALRYDSEDITPVNYVPPPCEFEKKRMQ